jgi:uracil-DNA glycosylase
MIVFLGDKPSSKNKNANVPFVGTKSYKTLLSWFYELDVDVNETVLCNVEHLITYSAGFKAIQLPNYFLDLKKDHDVIIALGNEAEKKSKEMGYKYFKLPHPSPKNRKLNDKKSLQNVLLECKLWLEKNYEA